MRFLLPILAGARAWQGGSDGLEITVDEKDLSSEVRVGGALWLATSEISLVKDGVRRSSRDGGLVLAKAAVAATGADAVGASRRRVEIVLVRPGGAPSFERTTPAVQRCKNDRKRSSSRRARSAWNRQVARRVR